MSDSIGARLRQARELRHLTLAQASEATRVRSHYLQALEGDDYSAIASAAQARGFLRIYAEFLGLEAGDLAPAVQPPPAAPIPEESTTPADSRPSRPSLWDGLRERLVRRPGRGAEVSPAPGGLPTEIHEQPDEQTAGLPASLDAQTTRRTRAANEKKNAVR